ncbi:hypothetical protein ILUMI_17311 [Ignelater luminosus]|uniref:Uncharacterized protein n=1 Tax=Ignelater luminosus TaxID=2038154 RepID=A0A8K0CR87_IGNLU|nr:hypothetical protein ILUMI_17311 [Ignelater luminosus]
MSEEFIREYQAYWPIISERQTLSEGFIREFQHSVYWSSISKNQILSEDFIREFQRKVYWTEISKYQKLSELFILEFQDKVDWKEISKYQDLSEEFIKEFKDYLNWHLISNCQRLSEEFIIEFKDKVDWIDIFRSQNLSEEFIERFKSHNRVSKTDFCTNRQRFISEFSTQFKNSLSRSDLLFIRRNQNLPKRLLIMHQYDLNWRDISNSLKLSEGCIIEFKNRVDWVEILKYQRLSRAFIRKFRAAAPTNSSVE